MSGGESSVTIKEMKVNYKGYDIIILTELLYPKKLGKTFYKIKAYNEKRKDL